MSAPQLSIIVPVYNVENYLGRCVESLLSQNYKDIEIILVDDGSTDSSGSICDEYQEKSPIVHVIHQKNMGLSGARNSGLEIAEGKYVGFVDSDDWVESNFYSFLMKIAQEKESDVVSGTFQRIEDESHIKGIKYVDDVKTLRGEEIYCYFLYSAIKGGITHVPVCTKVYKRNIIGSIRFDEGVLYEDIAFNWRIISRVSTNYTYCNYPGYYYFVNKKSITKSLQNKFNYKLLDYTAAAEEIKDIYILKTKGKNKKVIDLLDTFIGRTHYSVLFKMIRSKCFDKELIKKEISLVKFDFPLLWNSSMSPMRKCLLLLFKVVPQNILIKIIYSNEVN